jgi:selenocysteine lyase/cysteine desulfurase
MNSKRLFLKSILASAFAPLALKAEGFFDAPQDPSNQLLAHEDFWEHIRSEYLLKPDYINLENGYYSMTAQPVLEAYLQDVRKINLEASYYMRTVQYEQRDQVRTLLAKTVGCELEELIITRNTTESIDTIISGIDWKAGDEALMAEQDYGSMLEMFRQQGKRFGIVNNTVSVPTNPKTDDELVSLYEKAITPRTRLLMICHVINITGHILPVKKICDMAHSKGVEVVVDGAHAIGHLDFKISDLGCDYYGSSLHKWLGVPLGSGLLYVRKEKIKQIWPLLGDTGLKEDDILKLNHTGTIPVATTLAIQHAISYQEKIGIKRKEERLRFLKEYWVSKVKDLPRVQMYTPTDSQRSCAIANVGIDGIKPGDLAKLLLSKYKIWTVAIDYAQVHGVRITPHVYTTTAELDQFVTALTEIASKN